MTDTGGLWDGRWVVCRAHTLAGPEGDDELDLPESAEPTIVGIEHLPPAVQPAVAALVGDLARPVDAQVALSLGAGGHALLTLRGDPAHVEVVVRGAGERPDTHPGNPLLVLLDGDRRAALTETPACVVDSQGKTTDVSPALSELVAVPPRRLQRDGLASVIDPADHDRLLAVARGTSDDAAGIRIEPADGGPIRWVDIHGVDIHRVDLPDQDPAGRLLLITELHARAGDLARAAHRASAAFVQASSGRARINPRGIITSANPALARLLQAQPDDLTGHRLVDVADHGDRAALSTLLDAVLRSDLASFEHEVRMATRITSADHGDDAPRPREGPPGSPAPVWVRIQVEAVSTATGIEADVEVHDVTARRRAESDQRDTVDALRSAFIHAPTPMAVIELDGTIREANSELRALLDLATVDSQRLRLADLAPDEDRDAIASVLTEIREGRRGLVECRLRRIDGTDGVVELAVSAVTTPDHLSPFAIAQVNDITARRDTEEKLLHQTLHDPLTGLANRILLRERLERAVATRAENPFALMFIDLDHFKAINDTNGHEVGDALLVEVSQRLLRSVRGDDTVARLGGDEFVVLAVGVTDQIGAQVLAEKVRHAVAEPLTIGDLTIEVTASVGVVLAGSEHATADALLRDADLSMYGAKSSGRDRSEVKVGGEISARPAPIDETLRSALATDGFVLHHQPVIDLRTGRAAGTEALLRVTDPVGGARAPSRLLEGVTDAELLTDLAGWVLDRVLAQMTEWDAAGIGPLSMWLNLSGPELGTDSLLERVSTALTTTGISATRLHLEIPEPAMVLADTRSLERLRTLAALGVRLGIDDFGTGSTSFVHLRSLPVHFLKIDPSIGRRLREPGGRAVVEAVVAVGRALGLDVVAEGIEDRAQLEILAQMGCTHAQGNLFAEPGPIETLVLDDGAIGTD